MSLKLKVKLGRISGILHTCEWCKYGTRSLNLFESHLNKCSPSASSIASTSKRLLQTKKRKKYWHKCDSCEFTANMIKEMTHHKAKYHGLKVIPCKECDYLARNRSKLNRHIGYKHTKSKNKNTLTSSLHLSSIEQSSLDMPNKHRHNDFFDFKLEKYYNEVINPISLNASNAKRNVACRFCGCHFSDEEQFLNHLQNFHIPNDCIEHEIQTLPVAGKRKSCEISLYKCTRCSFCSEHKLVIVGHIIDCHPSCLVATQFGDATERVFPSFHSNESSPKRDPTKTFGYSCSDCLYKTNFKRNLKLHRTHHGADAPFRCNQCNFAAFHEIAVSRHRNNYHAYGPDKSFDSVDEEGNLAILSEDIKEEPLSDYDSKTVCADLSSGEQPKFEEQNEQIWQCSICPAQRYNDQKYLLKHMRIKHNQNDLLPSPDPCSKLASWKCVVCPFVARTKKNLKLHMIKRKHGDILNDENLQPTYDDSLPTNELKLRDSPKNVKITYNESDGKPLFKCEHCPVSFGTYQAIAVHIAKAHKNEVVYKCHECPFTSNRKYLLRNHFLCCTKSRDIFGATQNLDIGIAGTSGIVESESLHNACADDNMAKENNELVKYYGCSKCSYKTFRNFNLKKHIRLIHKGAKMVEILCQEEVHSIQDFEHKVDLNSQVSDITNNENSFKMSLDNIKHDAMDEMAEPVDSTFGLSNEQELKFLEYGKMSQSLSVIDSEKQIVYYSDSKRMKCYKCLFCPKVTKGWNHYILHRKMHFSAMAPSKHKCKHCSYSSTSLKFLKKHELLHKETEPLHVAQENFCPLEKNLQTNSISSINYSTVPPEYKVKSGYQCDACPFRAKDLKTFYVHKNLHNPRDAKYRCTKCTYQVDCISKLKVHSKVHTMEYLISNYKSIGSKDVKEHGKCSSEIRTDTPSVGGMFSDVSQADRNKQEELDDCMETARSKHCIMAQRKLSLSVVNSSLDTNPDKQEFNEAHISEKIQLDGFLGKKSTLLSSVVELKDSQSLKLNSDLTNVDTWHCERCPFISRDSETLHKHITLHMNKRMFECVYCNYSVPTYYFLLEHMKLHQSPNQNLIYAQSSNNLQSIENIDTSLIYHPEINENLYEGSRGFLSIPMKAFKCMHCPFSSRLRIFLVKHLKGHMNHYDLKCLFCTYTSDNKSEIRNHSQIHFDLPGSDMNPYPESGHILSKNGKMISCHEYSNEFMEGIYSQFNLNDTEENKFLGSFQIKTEVFESYYTEINDNMIIELAKTETSLSNSSHVSSDLKIETDKSPSDIDIKNHNISDEKKGNIDIFNESMEASQNNDSKKEEEEDEYIEIDAADESENCDDSRAHQSSELDRPTPLKDNQLELPCICKYCGRILKCLKSLAQHEASHVRSCSYIKWSTSQTN